MCELDLASPLVLDVEGRFDDGAKERDLVIELFLYNFHILSLWLGAGANGRSHTPPLGVGGRGGVRFSIGEEALGSRVWFQTHIPTPAGL